MKLTNTNSHAVMQVIIDTSPLGTASANRGIGMYTRLLAEALDKSDEVIVSHSDFTDTKLPTIKHYPFYDLFFSTLPLRHPLPTVVTIHDVIPLKFPKEYPVGKRGLLNFYRQKLALASVKKVITDSYASKIDLIELLGVPADKISVVYLAANPAILPVSQSKISAVKKKLSLPSKYVCYVGDINFNKNIPQLIKALRYLPDHVSLVCIGSTFKFQDIPEWHAIESQIALTNVASRVSFITSIDKTATDTLAAVLQGAICYVQPSLYEGFGLPVVEAQQCGVPVVAARNSSLVEIAGPSVAVTEAADAIAEGILEVMSWSSSQRAKKIVAGKQWATQYSWDRVARETIQIYKEVLRLS